ncbi:MAG: septal ring lytic transglycosylase RlpA family protein [Candidatus Yanofskybacteria bacterium]|nr:septal ring lytic transglycosylase RlpA family protein [Candidatus Yanofskybacteria bacterium]
MATSFSQLVAQLYGKSRRARRVLARALFVSAFVAAAVALVGPLTYDEHAHAALNDATLRWSWWGDQVVGFDVTAPRQNLFSLARDLDRVIPLVDHGTVHRSRMLGFANFVTRGGVRTVGDVIRWFGIPLTAQQARMLQPCRSLDTLREGEPLLVQADPYQYGIASWYGPGFHGRLAASGEIYNMYARTAAHRTLPLQSVVRVVSQRTGRSTVVRINDRGPYVGGRIIDMSYDSKQSMGMGDLAAVYIERIDPTALEGDCP